MEVALPDCAGLFIIRSDRAGCRSDYDTYHGNKMQEVHAWFIGFGIGQFEQRSDPKAGRVSRVTPLWTEQLSEVSIIAFHGARLKQTIHIRAIKSTEQCSNTHGIHVVPRLQHQPQDGVKPVAV